MYSHFTYSPHHVHKVMYNPSVGFSALFYQEKGTFVRPKDAQASFGLPLASQMLPFPYRRRTEGCFKKFWPLVTPNHVQPQAARVINWPLVQLDMFCEPFGPAC